MATKNVKIVSGEADGVAAVGHVLDVDAALVTAGAKLLSVKNAGVEKFAIDKDGRVVTGLLDSLSTPLSINAFIDNNNDGTTEAFTIYHDVTTPTGGKELFQVRENGEVEIYGGPLIGGASPFEIRTKTIDVFGPSKAVGTITIDDNNLTVDDWIQVIGLPYPAGYPYLIPGVDFTIGATPTDTAANLATAINGWGIEATAANTGPSCIITVDYFGTWGNRFRMSRAESIRLAADYWNDIAWSPTLNLFAAVGGAGPVYVATTSDGFVWTTRPAPAGDWQSICWGNGVFVAVGYGPVNQVMTSPDGIAWTPQTPASNQGWKSVAFDGGVFVAVTPLADAGRPYNTMNSSNGISWVNHHAPSFWPGSYSTWMSVAGGGGSFVAVADIGGTEFVMVSTDGGNTWSGEGFPEGSHWRHIAYGAGQFMAVSDPSGGFHQVATSPTGLTGSWTMRSPVYWGTIGFTHAQYSSDLGQWMIVSWDSFPGHIQTSLDGGATWSAAAGVPGGNWKANAWSSIHTKWVCVGFTGPDYDMSSPDGATWTIPSTPKYTIGSTPYTDLDGKNWWHFAGGVDNPPAILLNSQNQIKKDANRLFSIQNLGIEAFSVRRGIPLGNTHSSDKSMVEFYDELGILRSQLTSDGTTTWRAAERTGISIVGSTDYTFNTGYEEVSVGIFNSVPASFYAHVDSDQFGSAGLELWAKPTAPGAFMFVEDSTLTIGRSQLGLYLQDTNNLGRLNARADWYANHVYVGLASDGSFFGANNVDAPTKWLFSSMAADGATSIGFDFDTYNALSVAGSKLLSLKNFGVEKLSVDYAGNLEAAYTYKHHKTAVDYLTAGESVIGVTDTTITRTITISTVDIARGSATRAWKVIIKDESGTVTPTEMITVVPESGTIDGDPSVDITVPYGVCKIYSDGTNLWTE